MNIVTPPETLPEDTKLFKYKRDRHTLAVKKDGAIAWLKAFGKPSFAYYWSQKLKVWKKVKPNPDAHDRHDRFHRGVSINPAGHRKAGFAMLVGTTVLLETAEGNIGV